MKKLISLALAVIMLLSLLPVTAFAAIDFTINSTESSDDYYNLISKRDWDNAPGISEAEIVLNNDTGTQRQVIHMMTADVSNEYVSVIPTYAEMNTSVYQTATMYDQAKWIDDNMEGQVIGVMNCCLSWYSGYPADRVGEPLGFMMLNGEIMFDPGNCGYAYGNVGFPTCVVINKDTNADGEARPTDIPKLEMVQIRTSADLDGWEDTVIPISSGYIVKDGVNQYSASHTGGEPRSVVGITADGQVVIMENDGRQSPFSEGMNMYELAEVMIAAGCVWAANCDGGGSSTFVSRRPGEELKVNNSPSDGGERPSTSGICFITTAPSDGTFVRANVGAEAEYYTPYSSVQFSAVGADVAGGAAEIPEAAEWALSDDSFGSLDQNGLFVSNGKTGAVSAQIVYEGKVYGSYEINIVIPDAIHFSQSTLTVPNGKTSTFSLSATYDIYDVVSKASDFTVALSNDNMGTLNGYELTATEDLTVTGGAVLATLVHNPEVTATMDVVFGKASEVIWDFENGFGNGWYVEHLQQRKNGSHTKASFYNNVYKAYTATAENGMVHDGTSAGAVYSDTTYATLNWVGVTMRWAGETVTYENAKRIGMWVYIPKDAVSTAIRFCFTGVKNGEAVGIDSYPVNYGDTLYFEESGWVYCSVDVSEYDSITLSQNKAFDVNNPTAGAGSRIEISCQLSGGSSGEYNWQTTPGVAGINTFFVDNMTVDYSEACEDREAPVFGEVKYVEPISAEDKYLNNQRNTATVTNYKSIGFSVDVTEDTTFVNATGLNGASAKAYIDGNEVGCKFNGKTMSVDSTELKNGVHTIKFTICDKAGNYSTIIRKINVQAANNDANIWIAPQTNATLVPTGSQYWVDVVAKNVEDVQSVTLTLDLNNVNEWMLEHMETLYGFTASYTTDIAGENLAYITITRTGEVEATGEKAIVSIPVQTWEFKEEEYPGYIPSTGGDSDLNGNGMYDPYECWQEFVGHNYDIIINPLAGQVEYTNGTTEMFSGDKIQVDTERQIGCWWGKLTTAQKQEYFLQYDKSSWHLHSAGEAQDKAATCTENGYIGRVFCTGCSCVTKDKKGHDCDTASGCGAVLVWGTTISATGHEYQIVDGVLQCANGCGKIFSGDFTDGKTYIDGVVAPNGWLNDTYYIVDGTKVTGQYVIDGTMYTFGDDGVYQPDASYTGFYHDGTGWMYFMTNFQKKGFVVIDGNTHYFDDRTGYAPTGSFVLGDREYKVEGEQGKVLGAWGYFEVDGVTRKRYYYSLRYYKNQWLEVDGEMYYFNNDGYALIGKRAIARSGEYLGGYEFDMDGKMISPITGPFTDYESGAMYFAEDGVLACNKLVKYDGDYYFARSNCLLITWGTYLSEEQTNGLVEPGNYSFGADGKMVYRDGVCEDDFGKLCYYINGAQQFDSGLVKWNGDYYYVRENGLILTWGIYVSEEKANGLVEPGNYSFGADGKMVYRDGVCEDDFGKLCYYINGAQQFDSGLVEWNGDYYYVRENGLILTWGIYVSEEKANGLVEPGNYSFGADGKMVYRNGVCEDDFGKLCYYINGAQQFDSGLVEWNGDYYYVRENGLILTWGIYVSEEKANGLVEPGDYEFGADGKMIVG